MQFPFVLNMKPYTVASNPVALELEHSRQSQSLNPSLGLGIPACVGPVGAVGAVGAGVGGLDTVKETSAEDESMETDAPLRAKDRAQSQPNQPSSGAPNEDDRFSYHLVGVVIHSGTQANAGHYYCFLKDRRFLFLFLWSIDFVWVHPTIHYTMGAQLVDCRGPQCGPKPVCRLQ